MSTVEEQAVGRERAATEAPGRPARRRSSGLIGVLVAVVLGVGGVWWLLAEPVQSRLVWHLDEVHNHGLEVADLVGVTAMLAAAWLGLRGLSAWLRSRRGDGGPEGA